MKFIDRTPQFKARVRAMRMVALRDAGQDLLLMSRTRAPLKKGALRRESELDFKMGVARVRYWAEYAGAQEAGERDGIPFRNYTTAGTGAHYLENAGKKIEGKMDFYFEKHLGSIA